MLIVFKEIKEKTDLQNKAKRDHYKRLMEGLKKYQIEIYIIKGIIIHF